MKTATYILLVMLGSACGGGLEDGQFQGGAHVGSTAMQSTNGMTANGMTANGMTANGMTANGMTANGMTANGMTTNGLWPSGVNYNALPANGLTAAGVATPAFATWWAGNVAGYSDMVMTYLVKCALPAGQSLSYKDATGVVHTWPGNLGLAPVWASGKAIPVIEQQLMSACLAAHANKYGQHVDLSIRGQKSDGTFIPVTDAENTQFSAPEACFWGNIFDGTGVFAGADKSFNNSSITSIRACAIDLLGQSQCPPLTVVAGGCGNTCKPAGGGTDPSTNGTYVSCTTNGVAYRPMTTHLQPADVYHCGDGVCQFTESCYSAATNTGCLRDCGVCP